MNIICRVRGHRPDRGGARHDGQDYWSTCRRCGAALIRDIEGWRDPRPEETADHAEHLADRRDQRAGVSTP